MMEARELCVVEDPSPIPLTENVLDDLELEGQQLNTDSPEAAEEEGEETSTIPARKSS